MMNTCQPINTSHRPTYGCGTLIFITALILFGGVVGYLGFQLGNWAGVEFLAPLLDHNRQPTTPNLDLLFESSVKVNVEDYWGSGVQIITADDERLVLTAAHVVAGVAESEGAGPKWVDLQTFDPDRRVRGQIVAYSANYMEPDGVDLALIRPAVELAGLPVVARPTSLPAPGQQLWTLGYGAGLKHWLVPGWVVGMNDHQLRFNSQLWYGHSGSGVFVIEDDGPRLVGILSQFTKHPMTLPRTPMEAETRIWEFLEKYRKGPRILPWRTD